ncbi:hypothetical protein VK792_02095 [Mesobacterium sp. TK19101]|uniref:Uncharacterized protein n=1 Tax=Mesobacterium hydrothermale TaxID=3111907 RepID=A0ABU6HDW8_9RHOB|nr:hypothetical protein [Mesobacterium sp. TK19101]MEC3860065.1 hypothetical protein [Mesobacterium sp. TK19101]
MQRDSYLSAVLVLPDLLDFDAPLYWPAVKRALDELDSDKDRQAALSDDHSVIAGEKYAVRVTAEISDDFGPSIRIDLFAQDTACPGREARRLLRRIVAFALRDCEADFIYWSDGKHLLDRQEFSAFSLQPDFGGAAPEQTGPDLTDAAHRRLTAASWMMTGMVATVSPPLGAALYVYGGLRGQNLRRVTQALCLAGLFALLEHRDLLPPVYGAFF